MKRWVVPVFLGLLVLFTFAVRSVYLWRDFVFVYDQGRDALEVQRILSGNLTLIGPTTGLFGVFLGPLHYYMLTPLYVLGGGNPIIPAYAFILLSALSIIPIFIFARKIAGKVAGIMAVLFYAFSFVQWQFSRWLSNPTNLPLAALLMFLCVLKALETKKMRWFALVGLLLGVCMQLESANAVFLIPTMITVFIIEYAHSGKLNRLIERFWIDRKFFIIAMACFGVTLVPQGLFELLHGFPLTRSLIKAFQTTHRVGVIENLPRRVSLLFDLYARGWFWRAPWRHLALAIVGGGSLIVAWASREKLLKIQAFRVLLIWFVGPLIFHLTYTGNYGNFWDYYIIGQYVPLYILISVILVIGLSHKQLIFRLFSLCLLLAVSFGVVIPNTSEWLRLPVPYTERISLSLQLDAIKWVESEAGKSAFGMWAYTPSAQDDTYKYLFSYMARYNGVLPVEHPESTKLMFLIVEDDPGNPKRREQWIKDMSAIGRVIKQEKFGAITVFEVERKLTK